MKENFKNALTFALKGNFQKCIIETESISFEKFLDLALILKDNSFSKFDFWSFFSSSKHFIQFINHPYAYIYLAKLFKNLPNDPGISDMILFFAQNQSNVLIQAIRVSKAFLADEWYSVFEKQFQNHPDKYLRDHFQSFTFLKRIDNDLWRQVEKKSSCLRSFENSHIELLNELALWYETNSNQFVNGSLKIHVEVLNIAVDYLLLNKKLDISKESTEKEISDANIKSLQKVKNFKKKHRITPVFDWLNTIRNWKNVANNLLQRYCFDLNYEPEISNEGIISFKPVSVVKIKEWENNGRKINFMFNHYSEIVENETKVTQDRITLGDLSSNNYEYFVDNVHFSAEKAWVNTFENENIFINRKEHNFKTIFKLFQKYSKSSLLNKNEFDWLRHDSYRQLINTIHRAEENIDSSSLVNMLICNFDQRKHSDYFNRMNVSTNLCSTPFLKFGDNLFVFKSVIANTRPYTFLFNNLLNQNDEILNKGIKNELKLSAKFEDRISKLFFSAGFSTNLENDKKFVNEETGENGDLDALAYKDGYLFVIEAKLASLRVTLEDVHNELSTAFLKGASLLNKAIKFIESDFIRCHEKPINDKIGKDNSKSGVTNIKEKLGIKETDFKYLKICPLIVSTSFESDHEYIEWGDMHFLKISWHELMMILNEENNPKKIIERIETNDYWKFLDMMPTPSITENTKYLPFSDKHSKSGLVELFRRIMDLFALEDYNKAKILLLQAISMYDNSADLFLILGDCYAKMKDLNSAENYYNNAIELDPFYFKAYTALGRFYFDNDLWELSYQFLKKAIELNPLDKNTKDHFLRTSLKVDEQKILKEQVVNLDWDNLERRIASIEEIEIKTKFS